MLIRISAEKMALAQLVNNMTETEITTAFQGVWTERYRPQTLSDLLIDDSSRELIESFRGKEIPNILLCSTPGTGKTSLALVIVKDVLQCDYLYINASDESGIDTIRNKVVGFAQTKSFDGGIKVVILDESDYLSANAMASLRNTMETFAKSTRFILTANYKHKIIPAISSRCQEVTVRPTIKDAATRCFDILKQEGITAAPDQAKKVIELVRVKFPDLRKTINELQKSCINNVLNIRGLEISQELFEKIFDLLKRNDSLAVRKYLIENEEQFQADYDMLMSNYLEFIYEASMPDLVKKQQIATLAEHLYMSSFCLDKEINAFHCWIKLENIK